MPRQSLRDSVFFFVSVAQASFKHRSCIFTLWFCLGFCLTTLGEEASPLRPELMRAEILKNWAEWLFPLGLSPRLNLRDSFQTRAQIRENGQSEAEIPSLSRRVFFDEIYSHPELSKESSPRELLSVATQSKSSHSSESPIDGTVLIRFGLPRDPQKAPDVLHSHPRGWYFVSPLGSQFYSVFLLGFSEKRARGLFEQHRRVSTTTYRWHAPLPWGLFFPSAAARSQSQAPQSQALPRGPSPGCETEPGVGAVSDLIASGREIDLATVKEMPWTCSVAAGAGAQGKIEQWVALMDPSSWLEFDLEAFWSQTLQVYDALLELMPQIGPLLADLSEVLRELNPSLKLDLICSVIGAQTLEFLSPGGAAKKVLFLKEKLLGFKERLGMLKRISRLYDQNPDSSLLKKAAQKVGLCAL